MTFDLPLDITQPRRKAYSYLRFSTPEQSKGDSLRRQSDLATDYAAEHGLELDEELTFRDLGKSAYRGDNAATGRLGDFLEAVEAGTVPSGSYLLVESLDRLSREAAFDAQHLLTSIVMKGVNVVTLIDKREYSLDTLRSDPMAAIYAILVFMRANEESATKGRRLKESWQRKRASIAQGKPLTAKTPAWLRLTEDRQGFEVIEERADIVERIFEMTLEGVGQHRIAATFNEEGMKPWGSGEFWHRSYIAKVLANPSVIGTFQPHVIEFDGTKKRRRPLEPVEGYFPAIISEETFREAQALRQARGAPQRGRHAHSPITNILAGFAVCPKCGATMTRVSKGKRSRPSLVCSRAKAGAGCTYRSVPYEFVEAALMFGLPERLKALDGVWGPEGELEQEIHNAEETLDRAKARVGRLVDSLSIRVSAALSERLRVEEAFLEEAKETLRQLKERRDAATGLTIGARIDRALEALQPPSGEPSLASVNHALRTIFKEAVIDWTANEIALAWTHGGSCVVPYMSFGKYQDASRPGPWWTWNSAEVS